MDFRQPPFAFHMKWRVDGIIIFAQATIGKVFIIEWVIAIPCPHAAENLASEVLVIGRR